MDVALIRRRTCSYGMGAGLCLLALLLLLGWSPPAAAAPIKGYYRFPHLSGKRVVFSAENDLWLTTLQGGPAQRLTSHGGLEWLPRFSPNGKWIAYSAFYDGNMDVYLMSAAGGPPRRLTYHAGADLVVAWLPDSSGVVFQSRRISSTGRRHLFVVRLQHKGLPTRLPVGYASMVSFSPDGKGVAFTRFAREFRTWKRYTGGRAQDLWIGTLASKKYKQITTFPGTDAFPIWYKDRIYFISDRSGVMNIFSTDLQGKKFKQHTSHKKWDVRWPALSGDRIVYQLGADLWVLNLKNGRSRLIPISLPTDASPRRPRFVHPMRFYAGFDLSPHGKRLLISARGELFNVPVKQGVTFNITRSSGVREKFASFSPDGKKVLAFSDRSGEEELVLLDPLGEKKPKTLTRGGKVWRFWPVWSPHKKWIAFSDKNFILWIACAKSGKLHRIDQSKSWEIYSYRWSPDGRYLAYVKRELNFFHSIFLYDTKKKKIHRVTRSFTDDFSPAWSPDGKRLYFLSRRYINPFIGSFDFTEMVDKTTKIYALLLRKKARHPFAPKDASIDKRNKEEKKARKKAKAKAQKAATQKAATQKTKKKAATQKAATQKAATQRAASQKAKCAKGKEGKKKKCAKGKSHGKKEGTCQQGKKAKSKKGKSGKKKKCKCKNKKKCKCKKKVVVKIDFAGLIDRVVELPKVRAGHYYGLSALKDRLLLISHPTYKLMDRTFLRRRKPRASLLVYFLKKKKMKPLVRRIHSYDVSDDGKWIAYRRGTKFQVFPSRAPKVPKKKGIVKLRELRLLTNLRQEWRQIFNEGWRWQRDFYWAPNMAGIDWKAVRKKYASLLDRLLTREDLNDLLGELIGELGTSHTYIWGGDLTRFRRVPGGVLGADIQPDPSSGFYRIVKVFRGAPWSQHSASPLARPDLGLADGTYLLAINGQTLRASDNYFKWLQHRRKRLVSLTINSKPTLHKARRIVVRTISWWEEYRLRYIDWVESRRRLALKLSKGKVGYIHLPDMSGRGLVSFYKMWYPQLNKRAMVIDVRNNGGGFVSQLILQKLMRRIWAFFKARNAPFSEPVPERTFHGHVAVVTNQSAGSDGDIFTKSFQMLKLGPVFGMRTWGGVVGIRANKRFVDRGLMTQPEFAWWAPSLRWGLENNGVVPDYKVQLTPGDVERGKDPQLKATVRWLLQKLKQDPKKLPKLPPYPNKSIEAFRKRWKNWKKATRRRPVPRRRPASRPATAPKQR